VFNKNLIPQLPVPECNHDLVMLSYLFHNMIFTEFSDHASYLHALFYVRLVLLLKIDETSCQKRSYTKGLHYVKRENRA